ncbi:MAG TPA: hypothetical protein DEB39_09010 [Planctomycetaceae bacterium]|nr:hypothetical protein [Planctomycetaceae bacterium]
MLVLFPAIAFAGPAEEIAPLLNGQSTVVAHIDLTKLEAQKIVDNLRKAVDDTLLAVGLPEQEVEQYKGMVKMGLAMGMMQAQGVLGKLTKDGKATDAFLVVDLAVNEVMGMPVPEPNVFVAIPVGDKGKAETDAIRTAFKTMKMDVNFVRHGFVVGVFVKDADSKNDVMDFAKERFKDADPVDYPMLATAFERADAAPINVAILPSESHKEISKPKDIQLPQGIQIPPEVMKDIETQQKIAKITSEGFDWMAIGVDPQALSLRYVLKFKTADQAKEIDELYREQLNNSIEMLGNMGMLPLEASEIRKAIELFMPKLEGDCFESQIDRALFAENAELFGNLAKAGMAAFQTMQRNMQRDFGGAPSVEAFGDSDAEEGDDN